MAGHKYLTSQRLKDECHPRQKPIKEKLLHMQRRMFSGTSTPSAMAQASQERLVLGTKY